MAAVRCFAAGLAFGVAAAQPAPPAAPPRTPAPDEPVVVIDGRPVTRAEIERLLRAEIPPVRRSARSLAGRRDFVERQIDLALLAAEAERQGMLDDPEVRVVVAHALARRLVEKRQRGAPPPSEGELRAFFEAHRADFERPAERRVAAIVISPRRAGGIDRALARAEELRLDAEAHRADGAHFRRLVEKQSDDPKGRVRGGATPYFTRGDGAVPEAVREAAFALAEIGDVTTVRVGGGVQVLRLIGRRGPAAASFDRARERVRRAVEKARRQAAEQTLLDELRKKATVEIREKALRRIRVE